MLPRPDRIAGRMADCQWTHCNYAINFAMRSEKTEFSDPAATPIGATRLRPILETNAATAMIS